MDLWNRYFIILLIIYFCIATIILALLVIENIRPVWLFDYTMVVYVGGGYLFYVIRSSRLSGQKKKLELSAVIFAIILGLILIIPPIIDFQYVPVRYSSFDAKFGNMSLILDYPSPLIVPIRNFHNPIENEINVTVYNMKKDLTIESIRLSSPSDSILTVPRQEFVKVLNSTNKIVYSNEILAEHNSEIFNTTQNYIIDIAYLSVQNQSELYHNKISFAWNVQSLDYDLRTYYWIVMAGVLASRFFDFLLRRLRILDQVKESIVKESLNLANETDPKKIEEINNRMDKLIENKNSLRDRIVQDLDWKEGLWITFSFIVTLLVFSSFKQSVTLSTSALVNLSLAFGFGFTFDRTLELATRFKPVFTTDSSE
jgi:hypothetical protein